MFPASRIPRVKVCCIADIEEMEQAVAAGASAVGLVSAMPSGPGVISEEAIAAIAARVPPGVASVLLTAQQTAPPMIAQQRRTGVNTLQLVDRVEPAELQTIRRELPGIALMQVIHVVGPQSLVEAQKIAPFVNALLLDSGNPTLAVKELGGTGRVHDWHISRQICQTVNVPVFLAGGLTADNAAEALARVRPYGLDLCSGVRTNGKLDTARLTRFFAAVAGYTKDSTA